MVKSTVDEIRARFDADVERFSKLETGQQAAMDSPLGLELVAELAAAHRPQAILDLGCGAGNYTLSVLGHLEKPPEAVWLNDLSRPMLDRAVERVRASGYAGRLEPLQTDLRKLELEPGSLDLVVAAAVLHHLRGEEEWRAVFAKLLRWLRPGGGLYVYDLVAHEIPAVAGLMDRQYRRYLEELKGPAYRDDVLAYIEREDTPRPVSWLLGLLREAGFGAVDVVHANGPFAVYAAVL